MKKYYNIVFPIFMLYFMPPVIFIAMFLNFLIDSIVLIISFKFLNIDVISNYKKVIFKVWGYGFLADFIAALLLILYSYLFLNSGNLIHYVFYDPFSNIFSLFIIHFFILTAGILIYIFNKKFCYKNTNISKDNIIKLSLIMAIFTMPYTFLIPTKYLYKNYTKIEPRTVICMKK